MTTWTVTRYAFPDIGASAPRSQVSSWQRDRSVIAGTPESGKLQAFTLNPTTGARTTGTAIAYIDTPGDWLLETSTLNYVRWLHSDIVVVSMSLDDGTATTHMLRSYVVGSDLSLTQVDELSVYDDGSGGSFLQLFRGYYFQDGSGLLAGSTPTKDGDYLAVGTDGTISAPTIITTGATSSSPSPYLRSGPGSVLGVSSGVDGVTFTTANPVVGDARTWDDITTVDRFEMAPDEMVAEPFSDGRIMFLRWDHAADSYSVVTAQDTGSVFELVESFADDGTSFGGFSGNGNVTSDDKAVVIFGADGIVYDLFGTPTTLPLPAADSGMKENGLTPFTAGTFGVLYTSDFSAPAVPQIAYFHPGGRRRAHLRQYPRSPLRHWPPERSVQRSNRQGPGAYR